MGAGFVNGAIGGGMKGGVIGAFSAGLFHGIGSYFQSDHSQWAFNQETGKMSLAGRMAKIAAHGTAAGITEMLQGGKFGHGFVSAAGPELLHPEIGKLPGAQLQTLGAALLGGALSHATGGKFANGAVTAAFMWAFNHQSEHDLSTEEQEIALFAKETIEKYNPLSIERNREYGGLIYRLDGRLYSTEPVISSPCLDDCKISFEAAAALVPDRAIVVADWHTHGSSALSHHLRFSNEDFTHIASFLGNAKGDILFHRTGSYVPPDHTTLSHDQYWEANRNANANHARKIN